MQTDTKKKIKQKARRELGEAQRHRETYWERERRTQSYMENERAESQGSQAFCGLARLERWDLAGCGPLASLLKLGRKKKNQSQKMKRAKSYAKNAQGRGNTLGSFPSACLSVSPSRSKQ